MLRLNIADSEIHLWHVDQADFDLEKLRASSFSWLSEADSVRFHCYRFDRHRKQFLLGRVLIRTALSCYDQSIDLAEWRFTYNEYGKPAIHPEQQTEPLFFNLSHSGERLVLALAKFADIGVDIEYSGKSRRIAAIAGRYFSSKEAMELQSLPLAQQQFRFYQLWTLKEAYIKACGMGLAIPLQHFSYSFPGTDKISIQFDARRNDDKHAWQFWQMDAGAEYKIAVAARADAGAGKQKILSWQMTGLDSIDKTEARILRSV